MVAVTSKDVINALDDFNLQPRLSLPFSGSIDANSVTEQHGVFGEHWEYVVGPGLRRASASSRRITSRSSQASRQWIETGQRQFCF